MNNEQNEACVYDMNETIPSSWVTPRVWFWGHCGYWTCVFPGPTTGDQSSMNYEYFAYSSCCTADMPEVNPPAVVDDIVAIIRKTSNNSN